MIQVKFNELSYLTSKSFIPYIYIFNRILDTNERKNVLKEKLAYTKFYKDKGTVLHDDSRRIKRITPKNKQKKKRNFTSKFAEKPTKKLINRNFISRLCTCAEIHVHNVQEGRLA